MVEVVAMIEMRMINIILVIAVVVVTDVIEVGQGALQERVIVEMIETT